MVYTELICPICGQKSFSTFEKIRDIAYCTNCHTNSKKSICFLWQKGIDQEELDRLGAYMFHNSIDSGFICYGDEEEAKHLKEAGYDKVKLVSKKMVDAWYPSEIYKKIDYILLKIYSISKNTGEYIKSNYAELASIFFVQNNECGKQGDISEKIRSKIDFLLNYLKKEDLIEYSSLATLGNFKWMHEVQIRLTIKGISKIEELQKLQAHNKNVFVAMSFDKSADQIRLAIKNAIDNSNFSSILMDEIIHNHQIVPEMLRLIKESRFMIMDITQPNFGAYYEAGYAQGLGKEVIITCKKEVFDKSDKDFVCNYDQTCRLKKIANKPHFDIAQKQILVWNDYPDLTKKLEEYIRFLFN